MKISIILCLVAVALLVMCLVGLLVAIKRLKDQQECVLKNYENMVELNSRLRTQRHDYMNHLQVVLSMIELEEYESLKDYLEPVYLDIMKTGKALKTTKPAINALLAAKAGEAEKKKIDLFLEIKSDLKYLSIKEWEMCKVLANIIDNAITALDEADQEHKKIVIDMSEDPENYIFEVSNNGPYIPEDMQKNIFKYGVTSKKEEGHGIGLSIVERVVSENGGKITLYSDEEETRFTISCKKKGGEKQ